MIVTVSDMKWKAEHKLTAASVARCVVWLLICSEVVGAVDPQAGPQRPARQPTNETRVAPAVEYVDIRLADVRAGQGTLVPAYSLLDLAGEIADESSTGGDEWIRLQVHPTASEDGSQLLIQEGCIQVGRLLANGLVEYDDPIRSSRVRANPHESSNYSSPQTTDTGARRAAALRMMSNGFGWQNGEVRLKCSLISLYHPCPMSVDSNNHTRRK